MPKLELRNTSHGLAIFDTDDLVSKPLIQFNISNFLLLGKAVEIKAQGQNLQFPVELIPLIIKGLRTVYENPGR